MRRLLNALWREWPLHFVMLAVNWLPDSRPCLQLRGALMRPFLRSAGRNLQIGRNVTVLNAGQLSVGNDVYIAQGTWIAAEEPISLGDEVLIGPYCVLVSAEHTRSDGSYRFGKHRPGPLEIGRGVWLAAHVVVTAGRTIGPGTLVAGGAVVTGDLPANAIAGGIPARVLKEVADE
ncbi:MAG: acyltransferase [Armatimonadetes bacterium]|nr:acyltransferase [Armatimonadota bacterium]MDE2207791.1 acyltransferase [Armatimonadota bacterium]